VRGRVHWIIVQDAREDVAEHLASWLEGLDLGPELARLQP
jgi:hypothetical protein